MSNLQFQDFNFGDVDDSPFTSASSSQDYKPANKSYNSSTINASDDSAATATTILKNNVFSFKFYQQYFDIDTEQVQGRILNSFVPKWGKNFITDFIQPLPDLYGPIWIGITLIFSTAICGNLAHYIDTSGRDTPENNFRFVTGASTLIFSYIILVPFAIYSLLWYRKSAIQYSYLELLCAYGYSLAIFIPVSVLWVVHYSWFRWALILVSLALSGTVIFQWLWPAIKSDPNRMVALGVIVGTLVLHALLAVAFKEFYFDSVVKRNPIEKESTDQVQFSTLAPEALVRSPTPDAKNPDGSINAKVDAKNQEAKNKIEPPQTVNLVANTDQGNEKIEKPQTAEQKSNIRLLPNFMEIKGDNKDDPKDDKSKAEATDVPKKTESETKKKNETAGAPMDNVEVKPKILEKIEMSTKIDQDSKDTQMKTPEKPNNSSANKASEDKKS